MKKDMQDRKPVVRQTLEKVGVTNLKTLVETSWGGRTYKFVPKIQLTIDLPGSRKGVHMSRLVESISEAIEEGSRETHYSLEALGKDILSKLRRKHPFKSGEVIIETDLVVQVKTPVSGRTTAESHEIKVKVRLDKGTFTKTLSVKVLGNTVCPHAMEITGIPHIQRAIGFLEMETRFDNRIDLKDMIDVVENSFSSKVYTLLKSEDEASVVKRMHENPKFVEDVCRDILYGARAFKGCIVKAKVVSEESIHRHDVLAEASAKY
ncbi:MAG: GTP cyclohydrolase, FolE2/MptA family [Candidatus Altiarchaeota archaeon]|nr:GTP cyclohydrolase, FolE2/MptA family [Candidatus Altiarchaeota archaeon]